MPLRFISDKKTLLSLILPALGSTSSKNTLPALEGLLFSIKENELTVCGYDLERGVRISSEVRGMGDGEVIINAQKVAAMVKSLPDCDITFFADDKNVISISGGESDFSIHGQGAELFPNLPELGGDKSFMIGQGLLKSIITSTNFACSQTDARPILTGQLFKVEGKKLTVVATDNFRLAYREEKTALFDSEGEFSFVVPGKTLSEFSKLLSDSDEMVRVEFTSKYIIFKIKNMVLFSRLLEGDYIPYERAIPKDNKVFAQIKRSDFIDSVERAALFVDERLKTALKCRFENANLNISCKSQYGSVNENLKIDATGDAITIGFSHKYLLDSLRACGEETVNISMSTPLFPMILGSTDETADSRYIYLVLPVRLPE